MLKLELVKREGIVVIGGLGFGAFVVEASEALALSSDLGFALGVTTLEIGHDHRPQRLDAVLGQLEVVPVVGDGAFDV